MEDEKAIKNKIKGINTVKNQILNNYRKELSDDPKEFRDTFNEYCDKQGITYSCRT